MANKTNEINYNETISFLFQSYLINTYSHYLSNGGEKLSSNFTTMAKYQPYSFGQFCTYLQQGRLPLSSGNFVAENNHLINAQKTLQSSIYDKAYLSDCCSILSLVYDCALANSQSLQEYLKQSKLDIRKAELSVSGLKDLKNNCEINPYFAFSNSGYERSGGAVITNAKEVIGELNEIDENYVPWALDVITNATASACNSMQVSKSYFKSTPVM